MNIAAEHPAQSASVRTAKLLIDGQLVDSKTAEWRDIVNPATQEVVGRVPFATTDEVNAAVAAAHKAFQTWRTTPLGVRMRLMLKFQDLVRQNQKRIAQTLTAEQGKTLADAEGDIFRGLEVVEHACSISTLQQGEFSENVAGGVDTYTLRQPIGVCAGITPFNFPAMIPLWMFPMAIVCGNTFVLKPSEQDPLSTMELVELALEAGCRRACSTSCTAARKSSTRSARIPISRRFPSSARRPSARTSTTSRASTASACNR